MVREVVSGLVAPVSRPVLPSTGWETGARKQTGQTHPDRVWGRPSPTRLPATGTRPPQGLRHPV